MPKKYKLKSQDHRKKHVNKDLAKVKNLEVQPKVSFSHAILTL